MSVGKGQPREAIAQCTGLMSGVYSTFQMMATTIGGSTMGIRKTVRSASSVRERRFKSSATPKPSRSCRLTVQNESLSWTHSDPWRRPSESRNAKLRKGREKSHCVAGRVRLSGVRLVARR